MLKWFNSNAVFWPFMLGAMVMGDIWAACDVVNAHPKAIDALFSGIVVTLAMFWGCLHAYRSQR